jgi:hypothetical protein
MLRDQLARMNGMPVVRWTRWFLSPFRRVFSKKHRAFKRLVKMVKGSGYFDIKYYLKTYPDVAQSGMDPVVHYLAHGALEDRNPSDRFNTRNYVDRYADVAAERKRLNPLVHFLKHGRAEGRNPL